jgi:hypothetical protein
MARTHDSRGFCRAADDEVPMESSSVCNVFAVMVAEAVPVEQC